jgi:hypothetical protein
MKLVLKGPGTSAMKPRFDEPLSKCTFNFNLRRYTPAAATAAGDQAALDELLRVAAYLRWEHMGKPEGLDGTARADIFAAASVGRCRSTL